MGRTMVQNYLTSAVEQRQETPELQFPQHIPKVYNVILVLNKRLTIATLHCSSELPVHKYFQYLF